MKDIDPKVAAHSFLTSNSLGVLATLSQDGNPRARSVYYATDDNFAIYFVTLAGTRKIEDLAHHTKGAFVVSDESIPATLQIEGTIENASHTPAPSDAVRSIFDILLKRGGHFTPLTRLDTGVVHMYKLTPTWIRWGDFSARGGSDAVFNELEP
jgi:hypothetical protein|tara:strand:+ start:314306 stop:314767 length:462 start_codon:yes stop_codon:yes gene_type:complete